MVPHPLYQHWLVSKHMIRWDSCPSDKVVTPRSCYVQKRAYDIIEGTQQTELLKRLY